MEETESENRPLYKIWISLGKGIGIKMTLWKANLTLQRQEKQGDRWLVTEEMHLPPNILKELNWRIPNFLNAIVK